MKNVPSVKLKLCNHLFMAEICVTGCVSLPCSLQLSTYIHCLLCIQTVGGEEDDLCSPVWTGAAHINHGDYNYNLCVCMSVCPDWQQALWWGHCCVCTVYFQTTLWLHTSGESLAINTQRVLHQLSWKKLKHLPPAHKHTSLVINNQIYSF